MATDFELAVLHELGEIKAVAASSAATLTALNERLFTEGSGVIPTIQAHIQEIKDDRVREARWDRVHNIAHYSITPVLVVLHEIARKLGVSV